MMPAIFARPTKSNDLITITDFPAKPSPATFSWLTAVCRQNRWNSGYLAKRAPKPAQSCRSCARKRQTSCAIQSHRALEIGMTEQLMSVPAISKVPAGSVSGESRGADVGAADGEAAGTERGGSIALVLLVAVALVAALSAILTLGGSNAEQYTIAFLAVLASIGVFSLFAFACGILRVRAAAYHGNPLIKAVV